MIYRLLGSQNGVFKNLGREAAGALLLSGEWIDVTKYKNEEHRYERQPIFKNEKCEAKESGQQSNKRQADWVHDSCNTKANGQSEVSGKNVLLGQAVESEPVKKKRGRPRKK